MQAAYRTVFASSKITCRFLGRSLSVTSARNRSSAISSHSWRLNQKQTTLPGDSQQGATISRQWRRQYSNERPLAAVADGKSDLHFNTIWLRENCTCSECFNHATTQRNVLYYQLTPQQTAIQSQKLQGDAVEITWSDGHVSSYQVTWLQSHTVGEDNESITKFLWDNKSITDENVEMVPHEEYMKSDEGLKKLLRSLLKYGIGLVSGATPDIEGTQGVAERVCHVQSTLFGGMWSFTSDMARGDTAFTNIALGAHTDTTYLQLPCGIQVCIFNKYMQICIA